MKTALETFGFNLRMRIKQRKLKYYEAAEKMGVSLTHLNHLMRGERTPSFEMIVAISKSLGIGPAELFGQPNRDPKVERMIHILEGLPNDLAYSLLEVAEALYRGSAAGKAAKS
jgi:transcriptional regulator with XRE-family HTH domain